MARVSTTLAKIEEEHHRATGPQVVLGDLNQKGKVFTASQVTLHRAGMHRLEIPPTGFKSPSSNMCVRALYLPLLSPRSSHVWPNVWPCSSVWLSVDVWPSVAELGVFPHA